MSITFGKAKEILQPYCGQSGKSFDSKDLNTFVLKVLQYLLITGSPGGEKLFEINTGRGYFTAPYELDTPLKLMVNGRVGGALDKWFAFRSKPNNCDNYFDLQTGDLILEDPREYFTVYDGPTEFQIGVKGTQSECDAYAIPSGFDLSGREIFTQHKGAHIAGELLEIKKNEIRWSNVFFNKITGFVKTPTNGYVTCYWRDRYGLQGFLSDYSPADEAPTYRRFDLRIPNCPEFAKISIIGRTRLKDNYADNDRIPFDTAYSVEIAGQQVKAQGTDQLESAKDKDTFLQSLVERENTHKAMNNGKAIEVFYPTSPGTIKGIVRKSGFNRRGYY